MRRKSAEPKLSEKQRNIYQLPFRLHLNDKLLMLKLLNDDRMTFQSFVEACMQAYLRADPAVMTIVKDWRTLNEIPKEHKDLYTLSHRERADVMRELEQIQIEREIDPRKK